MKIDPHRPQQPPGDKAPVAPSTAGVKAPGTRTRGGAPGAGPTPSGTFEPSARARDLLRLRPQLEALPETSREERIARLAGLIARGEYRVDGERIARAMLRDPAIAEMLGLPPAP